MAVGSYCQRPALSVVPGESVRAAAERMQKERVGTLVVVEDERPKAVLTDRDIVLRVLAEGRDPGSTKAAEVAAEPLVAVPEDLPLAEATALMRRCHVRRVPVVDATGRAIGVLAADDLVRLIAEELTALADVASEQVPPSTRPAAKSADRRVEHYVKDVSTVTPETPAQEIARRMRDDVVGCVVVVDAAGSPCGLITDRDLVLRVVAEGIDPASAPASSMMSASLLSVDASEPLRTVAKLMSDQGVRRIPAVRDGRLVGIVTYDDFLIVLGRELYDVGVAARGANARERLARRAETVRRGAEQAIEELSATLDRLEGEARAAIGRQLDALRDRLGGV